MTLTGEHEDKTVNLVTLLPMAMPGLVRDDETIWIGLQTHASSGDPSRDVGHAITAALATEPGNPIQLGDLLKDGPRLQDLIDTSQADHREGARGLRLLGRRERRGPDR